MSIYQRFQTAARLCEETEFVKIYRMTVADKPYKVVVTKRKANGHTVIHCERGYVAWEQVPLFPRLSGRNYGDKTPIFTAIPEKDCVTLCVVKGKPNGFVGLDDGVFRCADNFDESCIHVMSWRRFKTHSIPC